MKNTRYFVLAALILVATLLRLAPLPANFSPIAAIALFAGAMFAKNRWVGLTVPLVALVLSDLVIGFHATQPFVYGSYALIALLGRGLINNKDGERPVWSAVGVSSLAASAVFFLVSNFGVWVEGILYPRTGSGLVACYLAAVPFFWNTLVSDLAFTFGLFGAWAFAVKALPQLRVVSGR
jgi:hypothetical protein